MSQIYFISSNTRHVSDGLSVHHQEFKTVHTATGMRQTDVCLHIQQQAYVKQILLSACTYSNRHMSNRYCRLLAHTATGIRQTDTADCLHIQQQAYVKQILPTAYTYSNRHMSNRYYRLLAHTATGICQTDTTDCLHIFPLQYVQSWTPDYGRKDRPKHVECYSK